MLAGAVVQAETAGAHPLTGHRWSRHSRNSAVYIRGRAIVLPAVDEDIQLARMKGFNCWPVGGNADGLHGDGPVITTCNQAYHDNTA